MLLVTFAAPSFGPFRPAPLSAVPSIIFRVGFWGFAALKVGGEPDIYIGVDAASCRRHPTPEPRSPPHVQTQNYSSRCP